MCFNALIANKFKFLTITIKKILSDFEFYIIEIIKVLVVETPMIVDDMLTKKQTIKFKNIKFYHDKIVRKRLNYVENVSTMFRIIFENVSTMFKMIFENF